MRHKKSDRGVRTSASSSTKRDSPASKSSRHHAETRHPGTADAAHRHARAGLRERNGPKPTRGARAPRPATSQHRVGRGAGEAAAHLACESVLEGFRQRKLRCRYFATRGGPAARSLRWPRKCVPKLRSNLRPKFCHNMVDGQLVLVVKLYRQQFGRRLWFISMTT